MLENSSREQVRHDANVMEESLNDEEIAADAAITETFQKLVGRVSSKIFNIVLDKMKKYAQNHILEPAVAGSIFAAMVKGVTAVQPNKALEFFIPHLCSRLVFAIHDTDIFRFWGGFQYRYREIWPKYQQKCVNIHTI
jgi:hypothetical protein